MAEFEEIREVVIDSEEIEEFVHDNLTKRGFVPSEDEVETLADIFFDFLIEKGVIDEVDEEDEY
jgi:YozD-like protein